MAFVKFQRLIFGTLLSTTDNGDDSVTVNAAVAESDVTFTDITTNNASTTKHGYLKKLSNVAGEFLNGVGNWVALNTVAVTSIKKTGSAALVGDVTLSEGTNVTLTQVGQDITIASTGGGGGGVDSVAAAGDTPMTGDIEIAGGTGVTVTQDDVDTITIALSGAGADGWTSDTAATWTRTADQTFTVTGDRTAVFQKGTYLKWTQTTVKYGIVASSSHAAGTTTVTIMTNTDYVLTAAAISANYYSYQANPQGFPGWFNYTPAFTASVSNPTLGSGATQAGRYSRVGNTVTFWADLIFGSSGAAAGSGTYRVGLPSTAQGHFNGSSFMLDSSASSLGRVGVVEMQAGQTYCQAWVDSQANSYVTNAVPWTWAASDQFRVWGSYEAT